MRALSASTRRSAAELLVRGALACAVLVLILLGLLPRTGWYRTETVLSGSMRPYFSPGDLIVVTPESTREVRVGQVISYHIPLGDHHVQSHRVIAVVRGGSNPLVRTKGDANRAADPWVAKLQGTTAWRVRYVVPEAGWAIARLRNPLIRSLSIFGAPLLLALLGLWRIWRVPPAGETTEVPDAQAAG
ncbi:MAG: signal peptidase [Gaiellaceae bacterium]|nr:signal peptidase [Gaiellaceae bacterium]